MLMTFLMCRPHDHQQYASQVGLPNTNVSPHQDQITTRRPAGNAHRGHGPALDNRVQNRGPQSTWNGPTNVSRSQEPNPSPLRGVHSASRAPDRGSRPNVGSRMTEDRVGSNDNGAYKHRPHQQPDHDRHSNPGSGARRHTDAQHTSQSPYHAFREIKRARQQSSGTQYGRKRDSDRAPSSVRHSNCQQDSGHHNSAYHQQSGYPT